METHKRKIQTLVTSPNQVLQKYLSKKCECGKAKPNFNIPGAKRSRWCANWGFSRKMENLAEVIYLFFDGCDDQIYASEIIIIPVL